MNLLPSTINIKLVKCGRFEKPDQTRRLSSGLNPNQTRLDSPLHIFVFLFGCRETLHKTKFMLLTVRISVRSTRFLITADSSSGVTSPFPSVNPSKNSLFHCSSGAERHKPNVNFFASDYIENRVCRRDL